MCSQYEMVKPVDEILRQAKLHVTPEILNHDAKAIIYPYSNALVITRSPDYFQLQLMRYALTPAWSTTAKPRFSSYNARLDRDNNHGQREFIYQAPAWRQPFAQQRCLIPLTSFIESCHSGSHAGFLIKFSPQDHDQILWAAGIWDQWCDPATGKLLQSFAILTDEPTQFIREVGHDRQPVFLSLSNAQAWLHPTYLKPTQAYDFLKNSQLPIHYQVSDLRPLKISSSPTEDLFS